MNKTLRFLYLLSIVVVCSEPNTRKKGFVDGDIIIGALFPIHEKPTIEKTYTRECGLIREAYGMHRVEVLLKTINEINSNSKILPGINLGVDIRDTCWYVPIALEQSIDFIKNSLSHQEMIEKVKDDNVVYGRDDTELKSKSGKAIASLIGPGGSFVTVQVQNLLQLFKIPQISYSATSADLSKKQEYKYFLRVVPSDKLQTQALADLISYFKFEYISLVNTQGNYGSQGIKELLNNIKSTDICTDQTIEIDNNAELSVVIENAKKLFQKDRAKVVVCFCQGETVQLLFKAMLKLNKTNEGFLIIGTDGWADRHDILGDIIDNDSGEKELSHVAYGGISIRLDSSPIKDFDQYFRNKNYSNSPGNPWFQEFWEQKFNCSVSDNKKYSRKCYGNESLLNADYDQDSKLGFVVKSVMTVAYGLHNLHNKLCPKTVQKCDKFNLLNGTALLNEMMNVSFKAYDNAILKFDSNGDPPGRYEIMNYQRKIDVKTKKYLYYYKKIGNWRDNNLKITEDIQWPLSVPVKSVCNLPCQFYQIKQIIPGKKCCWVCKSCGNNQYVNTSMGIQSCVSCREGEVPNDNRTGCFKRAVSYIKWSDATSIVAVGFSCIGIIASIVAIVILAMNNNTPVVKASTRELMYVILAGIIMCFLTTFPLLMKPTEVSCWFTKIMPGLSFSLIFGALVTKTNRICRILSTSKKKIIKHKGRFLTTTSQIVITFILNMIETIIISIMIYFKPPKPIEIYPSEDLTILICENTNESLFIPFGFDAVLVCLCTWYAFKTRNLPENFNEAKYIGFTMYTTCIIWLGFVSIYFGAKYNVIYMCYAINLSATTALFLLFFPKLYIIVLKPERNERSAFKTTTDIRCHIGPWKIENEYSKEKLQKFNMDQNLFRDLSRSSLYPTNINEYSCNNCVIKSSNIVPILSNYNEKSIQTEDILILDFLPQIQNNKHSIPPEISLVQMALLQFLDHNWNNTCIPVTDFVSNSMARLKCTDLDKLQGSDSDEEYTDECSLKNPMLACQITSGPTWSPSSNVSTDASSTISTMFLEYLKIHGRRFSKNNDYKSIKL